MSSSRPSRWWSLTGWSLHRKLIAGVLALLAVVCLVIGVAATLFLREYLVNQLDGQLQAAALRALNPPRDYRDGPPYPGPNHFPLGQPIGTVSARLVGGRVSEAIILKENNEQPALTAAQSAPLADVPADNHTYTRTLGDLGDYRLIARTLPNGAVAITGLPMSGLQGTVLSLVVTEVGVSVAGLVLAGLGGTVIVRLALRPLRRVAATAGRVAELPLDRGDVDLSVRVPTVDTDARTEVGQVGAALNRMLGHVEDALAVRQASETRVRQFVADASHELRTPLAAIRGYAELTRRGRDRDQVPPDVAHALRRVESESARMTSLVDDLLLLARIDSGRPLDTLPVELSGLVVDTVNDAHAAGPEHRWLLDLPGEPVTVPGDAARLHQVLANLLANARTHTPPGSTVTTGLATDNGWVTVTVTDDGPGIPEQLQPEIFERFARGDTSRSRAAGSTGLGLAIVSAVVEAHRGVVEVTSRPGRTSFTVKLPGSTRPSTADA